MKKIDKLITTSFIGPAILSYFVATFVLVMQFLWKYIDEILGKGLSILELLELIFYYAVTLIPMAVPITVLISSVMVFGDMAEKYELSSMKSAGVSLLRVMIPGIVVACCIGFFSIISANFLKPASLLQFNKRFLAIRKQKSALAIEEGIFNNAFNETIIRVDKIDKNKRDIHNVLIYDHTPNDKSLINVMSSKSGEMYTLEEGKYFVMKLDTGVQYKELEKKSTLGSKKTEMPFMRINFDQWTKTFDMSQFDAEDGLLNFNRNREDMMNSFQLIKSIDSFRTNVKENNEKTAAKTSLLFSGLQKDTSIQKVIKNGREASDTSNITKPINNIAITAAEKSKDPPDVRDTTTAYIDSLRQLKKSLVKGFGKKKKNVLIKTEVKDTSSSPVPVVNAKRLITQKTSLNMDSIRSFYETIEFNDLRDVFVRAQTDMSRDRDELITIKNINYDYERAFEKYLLRLNQQYSWAFVCVIFLFIGAPLGSIIRKGGYGYPLLVAILFYMIFIITTILGEKLVRNETIGGIYAAWLPCLVLLPFAGFLTIMAIRDVKVNMSTLTDYFYRLKNKDIPDRPDSSI